MKNQVTRFAIAAFISTQAIAQPSTQSSLDEEVALGWRFADCSDFYLLSSESAKSSDAKLSAQLTRLQRVNFAAAVALVGEERFRVEVAERRKEFIARLQAASNQAELKKIDTQCIELLDIGMATAEPKIRALANKKQAEKNK